MRNTGIPAIGDVPWGTHFCQFYQSKQDLIDILVPYFKAGLESHEFCMWVTSEPLNDEDAHDALAKALPDVEQYIRNGQLEILDYSQWYTEAGEFEAGRVLRGWVERLEQAVGRGFSGLRLSGNTFWLEKSDWQDFTAYEAAVDRVIHQYPMMALCTYSLSKCGVVEIMDVVANHAFALIKRAGRWDIIESAERKKAETSLRQSEERLRMAIASTGLGTWDFDLPSGETVWSDLCKLHFGLAPEHEVAYETFLQGVHPEDRQRVEQEVETALSGKSGGRFTSEYRTVGLADGRERVILAMGRVFFNSRRDPIRFIGTTFEVTERKQAEQALREAEERRKIVQAVEAERQFLKSILDKLPVMVCLLTPDHQVPFANHRFREAFGESNGRRCFEYLFDRTTPCPECQAFTPLTTQEPHHWEWDTPKGTYLEIVNLPFADSDGSPLIMEVDIDITERKRIEAEILKHRERLEELVNERTRELEAANARLQAEIAERKQAETELRESETILRSFFDSPGVMRGVVELTTEDIVHVSCNEAAAELYGIDRKQIGGKTAAQTGASQNVIEEWLGLYEQARRTGQPVSAEYGRKDTRGKDRWMLATASFLGIGESGRPRFAYTIVDLTDRKRAEEALSRSEARLRTLTDNLPEAAIYQYRHEPDGTPHVDFISTGIERLTGFPASEFMRDAATVVRAAAPEDRAKLNAAIAQSRDQLTSFEFELRHEHSKTGETHWSLLRSTPQRLPDGTTVWDGIELDITSRKRIEEMLRLSEEKFAKAFALNPAAIALTRFDDGLILDVNDTWQLMFGYSREEAVGRSVDELRLWASPAGRAHCLAELGKKGSIREREQVLLRRSGESFVSLGSAERFTAAGEEMVLSTWLDISDRKRAEEAVRASEERERARAAELEGVLDAAPVALFVARDPDCRHMIGSRTTYEMLRLPPGSNVSKSAVEAERPRTFRVMREGQEVPPEELPAQKAIATRRPVRDHEFDLLYEDGTRRNILGYAVPLLDKDGRPRGAVGALVDITERKRNEERLRQTQKLESIGLLAGGIAHDFNNLLTGVMGHASMILEDVDEETAEHIKEVLNSAERAATLTRQLLAYSGKGQFVIHDLDVSAAVNEISGLVEFSIPKSVQLAVTVERRLPLVRMDPSQLQQILMNLVINAGEAIGEGNPGRITVSTSMTDITSGFVDAIGEEVVPGRYVCIDVSDTGCGIDEEKRSRIFDPFFTTKFTGRGLGLAAVAGILRQQKGGLTLDSAPGRGTTFRVLLPITEKHARSNGEPVQEEARGTVMVVDDEAAVRDFIGEVLRRQGYRVLLANDGRQALDVCEREMGAVDAAIVDIVMPLMGANDMLPTLKLHWPQIRILLTSGYSEAEARRLCGTNPGAAFIQKPYTSQQIAKAVDDLLGVVHV